MAHAFRDTPSASSKIEFKVLGAYKEILGASDISWDGLKRAVRSPNYLSLPAMPKRPGQPDYGSIKCKVFFDPNDTVHQAIRDRLLQTAAYANAHMDNVRITYADGFTTPATAEVIGFVADFSQESGETETGSWVANFEFPVDSIIGFVAGSPAE